MPAGLNLAPSKRSDGVWLFALDGTLQSLPRGSADPPARTTSAAPIAVPPPRRGSRPRPRAVRPDLCGLPWHRRLGRHSRRAADGDELTLAELMTTIGNGRESMPAFGRAMRPEDLHDLAAYILEELAD